jgi:hypothetical protein
VPFHQSITHPTPRKHTKSCKADSKKAKKAANGSGQNIKRPRPYKRFERTLGPISSARLRGERSEKLVLKILKELVKHEQVPPAVEEILRYPDNSPQDKKGYDIAYATDRGRIDLQVKSSWRSREKFLQKHPDIICIVAEDHENESAIIAQLVGDIWRAYTSLQTNH